MNEYSQEPSDDVWRATMYLALRDQWVEEDVWWARGFGIDKRKQGMSYDMFRLLVREILSQAGYERPSKKDVYDRFESERVKKTGVIRSDSTCRIDDDDLKSFPGILLDFLGVNQGILDIAEMIRNKGVVNNGQE